MRAKQSPLFLVDPSRKITASKRPIYGTGEEILHDGIYRVIHRQHRLPHEVTLLRGQRFPKCAQCQDAVKFQLLREAALADDALDPRWQIRLYELPVLDDEDDLEAAI